MKALLFAILRTALVIGVGMIASAMVAVWIFEGKTPASIKEWRETAKNLANFHEAKKQMVARSFNEAELIKDDSDQPAGVNSKTIALAAEEEALLDKLNAEILKVQKDAVQERALQNQKDMILMKNKLVNLQAQLDRIENQNRVLRLKVNSLVKDNKIQK